MLCGRFPLCSDSLTMSSSSLSSNSFEPETVAPPDSLPSSSAADIASSTPSRSEQRRDEQPENSINDIEVTVFASQSTPYSRKSLVPVNNVGENGVEKRANKELHKVIDQTVTAGLVDAMICLDDIIETSLPDEKVHFEPAALLKSFKKGGKNAIYRDGKWLKFENTKKANSETNTTLYFESILVKAERFIKGKGGPACSRHYSDAFHKKPIKDEDCDRKPDVVLHAEKITRKDIEENNLPTWRNIDGLLEIKKYPRDAPEGHEQLAGGARLMFKEQPNRRSVFGVLLAGDEMTFCVFDRSGKVSSLPFNIHDEPEQFLRVIVGLAFIDRETCGIDKTINLEGPKENWTIQVDKKTYPIKNIVHKESGIRGRGTVCYEVLMDDKSSGLVKDSWVDMSRDEREVDTLNSLKDTKHNQYIPKVVDDEVVQFEGEDDTTARIRRSLLRKLVNGKKVTWKWIDEKYKKNELRRHERILLTPFGMRIEQFRSLEELLNAIKHFALGKCLSMLMKFTPSDQFSSYPGYARP